MLAQLATLAVLIAVVLFLLSLPFGEGATGGTLRRAAAFSFILAIVPSFLICAIQPFIPRVASAMKTLELVFGGVGLVAVLAILSFAAHGFLDLRKRFGKRLPRPADGVRYAKRAPESQPRNVYDDHGEDEL
jgi:hypothetical protein